MMPEAQQRRALKRDRLIYKLTDIAARLLFGTLTVSFCVMIMLEAFERAVILGVIMIPFPVLAFYAFLLPSDYVQPFWDWRVSLDKREQEIDAHFGRKETVTSRAAETDGLALLSHPVKSEGLGVSMTTQTVLLRASLICTILVAIGLLELPYGYYTFLRICLCGAAIAVIYFSFDDLNQVFLWLFGGIAVLYNPIIPIYLGDKFIWIILNVLTILIFWSAFGMVHRGSHRTEE